MMTPTIVANTVPTRPYTNAAELKPARVAAERAMRFKYVAASSMLVQALLYILPEIQDNVSTAANVMIRVVLVRVCKLKVNITYRVHRMIKRRPVQYRV